MLAKSPKSAGPIDLETVRRDLAEAEAKLTVVLVSEAGSLSSPSAFTKWCADRDAAAVEVERQSKLAERAEADAAEKAQQEQQAALAKRVDAQRAANKKLADRIRSEGGAAVETLLGLIKDVAEASALDEQLNTQLGPDAEQIIGADYLARARQAKPREIISEQEIALWCFAENGNLIGDQDAVIWHSEEHGSIRGAQRGIPAVRRKFKQTEFYPAERAEHTDPFLKALRLPLMDRPGFVWDSRNAMTPAEALQMFASGGAERQLTTELTPLEPFTPSYRR